MKVLKFSSPTCAPCANLDQFLKSRDLGSIEVTSLSLSENRNVFMKYGIRSVPMVIEVDDEGKEIQRWSGIGFKHFLQTNSSIEDIIVNEMEEVLNKM